MWISSTVFDSLDIALLAAEQYQAYQAELPIKNDPNLSNINLNIPATPQGSKKRPIKLISNPKDNLTLNPPKKKLKTTHISSPPSPPHLRLTLAIPKTPYPHAKAPTLLAHFPSFPSPYHPPNYLTPQAPLTPRITSLLQACPLPPFIPPRLPPTHQRLAERILAQNIAATSSERGEFLAWRAFARQSRWEREMMVMSGLEWEDWEDERMGVENGLPEWKRGRTGRWVGWGVGAEERRTPNRGFEGSDDGEGSSEGEGSEGSEEDGWEDVI